MSISSKLATISQNMDRVFDKGRSKGYVEGYEKANSESNEAEWNKFWDRYQDGGKRTKYGYAFYNPGKAWGIENFKPKYNITCKGDASACFYAWEGLANNVNFKDVIVDREIKIDTSEATNMSNFMAYSTNIVGELPTISFESAGANTAGAFHGVGVTKIEKVIVTANTNFDRFFQYCYNLEEVIIEGVIAKNGLNVSYSKNLNARSLESFVRALSTTTTGLTITFPSTAPNTFCTYLEQDSAWDDLIAQRKNWTFAYA